MFRTLLLWVLLLPAAVATGQPAGRVVVRTIHVHGNKVTRNAVVMRETGMYNGMSLQADSVVHLLTRNKLRLFNLQLFNKVDQYTDSVAPDTIDWHINLQERWYLIPTGILQFADRNINTWWADHRYDYNRVSAGLKLTNNNFRGNLETFSLTVQAGYTQRLGIAYLRPYLHQKRVHGFGFNAWTGRSTQTWYRTENNKLRFVGGYSGPAITWQAGGALCYAFRPRYAARHLFQLGYQYYRVADSVRMLNPGYFADSSRVARFAELNYRFEYNGTDNWNYSMRGEKLVTTTVVRAGIEGIAFQAFVNYEAGIFWHLGGKWYGAAISRGRVMLPAEQPYYFRNGLGSATDYVRGYEYYVTDGYHYGLLRADLRRELFNNTWSIPVRYFTAVPVRIYPKLFADVGAISGPNHWGNTLANTWMYSYGAGVDIVTLYDIKLRIEYARNHLGQNGLYLHFNSE